MRILLIEPDRQLAGVYAAALTQAGHQVMVCTGAQSAISAADAAQPDVVILELQLVRHSGLEFLYEFRSYAEWQRIPVIVHSMVPQSEFSGQWQLLHGQLGVIDYLYKPLTSLKRLQNAVLAVTAPPV